MRGEETVMWNVENVYHSYVKHVGQALFHTTVAMEMLHFLTLRNEWKIPVD